MLAADDIFTKAATLLEREGWVQGQMYGANGGTCAMGALQRVVDGMEMLLPGVFTQKLCERLMVQVREDFPHPDGAAFGRWGCHCSECMGRTQWDCVPNWNDSKKRTQHEVVRTMRRAALRFAREGRRSEEYILTA